MCLEECTRRKSADARYPPLRAPLRFLPLPSPPTFSPSPLSLFASHNVCVVSVAHTRNNPTGFQPNSIIPPPLARAIAFR